MIAILLCSTIGISLDMHFCQGNIKSIGFYTDANECGMYQEQSNCTKDEESSLSKIPCCTDSYTFLQNPVVEKQSKTVSHVPISQFLKINTYFTQIVSFNAVFNRQALISASPPLECPGLFVLYCNMLI
jgi:hypothetical protein